MMPAKGLSTKLLRQAIVRPWHGVGGVGIADRQTLYPRAQVVDVVGAAERQVGSFLTDVFRVEQDIAGQLSLDSKAPALLVGSPVCTAAVRSGPLAPKPTSFIRPSELPAG